MELPIISRSLSADRTGNTGKLHGEVALFSIILKSTPSTKDVSASSGMQLPLSPHITAREKAY
jgi:hypothetical protein